MNCAHCGDSCPTNSIQKSDNFFCCNGCKVVFEIFHTSGLETYYELEHEPGIKMDNFHKNHQFDFLELEHVLTKYLVFKNDQFSTTILSIPQIHCSACIWLLENLSRLDKGIISSSVNFTKKKTTISFNHQEISLKELAELVTRIGYEPDFSSVNSNYSNDSQKSLIYKIGISGFCFGNIMLFAFPEYLGLDDTFSEFKKFFGIISLVCALPVFFYSGWDYVTSGIKSIRQKHINIDVPIALGMITLFLRSTYEILSHTGNGYFDSLAGLIFFLLIGKWFQKKSYDSLTFDRDYTSYFPIAVKKYNSDKNQFSTVEIKDLKAGDLVEIRNGELIPADAILKKGEAQIDYSFVTGESDLNPVQSGENIYAGGRQSGSKIQIELSRKVNNSYLTELWNNDIFKSPHTKQILNSISQKVSKYFTLVILLVTFFTSIYWYFTDLNVLWNSVTAVLIVACPCALALSVPFTLGSATRVLGKNGLYLKSASVIETMSKITTLIFDKTGTITHRNGFQISFSGKPLSENELLEIKSLTQNSIHPLSIAIANSIPQHSALITTEYQEIAGSGIQGSVNGQLYKLGSDNFTGGKEKSTKTTVHISKNGSKLGVFNFEHAYRSGLKELLLRLQYKYQIDLLSGDNSNEKNKLKKWLPFNRLYFNQAPEDKLNYIKDLASKGEIVMMLGDGLNDAGALKQSHLGIAISDDLHQFSPASDAILSAEKLNQLHNFLRFSKASIKIIKLSFLISFLYNIIGLSFAVSGNLSPIHAAILMPLSSITVILFSTLAVSYSANKLIR